MTEQIKQELIEYGKLAGSKGYTPGISGNISSRYGSSFVITASGSANGYLEDKISALLMLTDIILTVI